MAGKKRKKKEEKRAAEGENLILQEAAITTVDSIFMTSPGIICKDDSSLNKIIRGF